MSSYFPTLWAHYYLIQFIFSYKLKVDACEKGSAKERKLRHITVNYLYVCFFFCALALLSDER